MGLRCVHRYFKKKMEATVVKVSTHSFFFFFLPFPTVLHRFQLDSSLHLFWSALVTFYLLPPQTPLRLSLPLRAQELPSWTKDINAVEKSMGLALFFSRAVFLKLCRTGSTICCGETTNTQKYQCCRESRENGECKGRRDEAPVIVCV